MSNNLIRSTFTTDRTMEFFSEKELSMQIGVGRPFWMLAMLKELIDNSLDACESSEIPPEIEITVAEDFLEVWDNGSGLPEDIIKMSLDYMIRVSDKNLYVSPSRGQLGNALKCLYAIPFVLNGEYGKVEIQTGGKLHCIEVTLDRIGQRPKIEYIIGEGDSVKIGTSIKIYEHAQNHLDSFHNADSYIFNLPSMISAYTIFNPHATFRFHHGEVSAEYNRTSDVCNKWIPSNLTSSYWYSAEKLRGLIAGYVALERDGGPVKTVGDFVSEFRGLAGSRKRKEVTDHLNMQRTYLHDLVEGDDISMDAVTQILVAMNQYSSPIKPALLGEIGKEHFYRFLPYVDVESIHYKKTEGTTEGLPYVMEVAFGILQERFLDYKSSIIYGLNWSPCLSSPIDRLMAILGDAQVDSDDPVVMAIHLSCPRFDFTDRGKSKLRLPELMMEVLEKSVRSVTKEFTTAKRQANREGRLRDRQIDELKKQKNRNQMSVKDAAYAVMEESYIKTSGNNSLPANARQIMYVARPLVQQMTGKTPPWKDSAYFTQTILPDFIETHPDMTASWDVVYDSRGSLTEPHTGHKVGLGTIAVRNYISGWDDSLHFQDTGRISYSADTFGPANRYKYVLFVEKEGFDELWKKVRLQERFDLTIMSTKGMSVTAARHLVEKLTEQGVTILVIRDFDKAGFSIVHTLTTSNRRYTFRIAPNVIDLGLRLQDKKAMNLAAEDVEYDSKVDPRISLMASGASAEEAAFLRSGGSPGEWTGQRVELNAMTSPQLISWVERKLCDAGVKKVIPCKETLEEAFRRTHRIHYLEVALREANKRYSKDNITIPDDLSQQIAQFLSEHTALAWDDALHQVVMLSANRR